MAEQIPKFCDQCGAAVSPDARFCRQCGYERTTADFASGAVSQVGSASSACPYPAYGDQRMVGSLDPPLAATIFFSVVLTLAAFFAPNAVEQSDEAAALYSLLILGLVVPTIIASCILMYRWWACLPPGWRQTSPGRAVGFSFIPFYCFYWWFIAYGGLASDLNQFMDAHSVHGKRVSTGLAHGYVIVSILGIVLCWVPVLTNLIGVVGLILFIPFALSATRASKSALVAARTSDVARVP